jgi:O-antigen/teichoic acid export membrane protein
MAKATFIGLRLLTLYLCAARIDRAQFGILAIAFTTAEICRYIGDWGTDTWALRQFADPNVRLASARMHWVMRVRLASSVVAVALSWIMIGMLAPQLGPLLHAAIALTAVTSLWLNLGVNWLQARSALRPIAGLLSTAGTACAAVLVYSQIMQAPIERQIVTLVTFELLMAVGVMVLALRHIRRHTQDSHSDTNDNARAISPVRFAQWWKAATPIALAALIALAYGRLDQYFVSQTADPAVLGDYTLAQRIVEPMLFVLAALTSTIYVRASAFIHINGIGKATRDYAWRWVRLIGGTAVVLSLLIGVSFSLLGPRWMPQYTGAQPFLWAALLCTVFRCANLCLTAFIQAMGEYRYMLRINIFNAITITFSVLVAGTLFGPIGAALGVCGGEVLNTVVQSLTLKKLLYLQGPE